MPRGRGSSLRFGAPRTSAVAASEITAQADRIARGSVDLISREDLEGKLALGRPLRIKFGVDPTAPDIHLGHAVGLTKLRELQDAGHQVVLIIGDWTARVGDPSGRSATRPMLSQAQIAANADSYRAQAFQILDPERTEVRSNGEWYTRMGLEDVFALASQTTVNQLLRRNDFDARISAGKPVSALELLYPLMQAHDSQVVKADIEVGGTDQLYNLMLGRDRGGEGPLERQVVMTLPLLTGTDGHRKMSKSLGNQIGVTDSPEDQFGRTMRIPDESIAEWHDLLFPGSHRAEEHPNQAKRRLARSIVERFHSADDAREAEAAFDRISKERSAPDEMPEARLPAGAIDLPALLVERFGAPSKGRARQMLQDGALTADGVKVQGLEIDAAALAGKTLRLGRRRFLRVLP